MISTTITHTCFSIVSHSSQICRTLAAFLLCSYLKVSLPLIPLFCFILCCSCMLNRPASCLIQGISYQQILVLIDVLGGYAIHVICCCYLLLNFISHLPWKTPPEPGATAVGRLPAEVQRGRLNSLQQKHSDTVGICSQFPHLYHSIQLSSYK